MQKHSYLRGIVVALGLTSCVAAPVAANAAKVNLSPSPVTVNEGSSQVITFTLDQPIISDDSDPAYANIVITNPDSAHMSLSADTISYTASDWYIPKMITLTTIDDGIYNSGETVTITGIVDSNSEYYSDFAINLPVTINNIDPALSASVDPAPVVTAVAPITAPNTGLGTPAPSNRLAWFALLSLPIAFGATYYGLFVGYDEMPLGRVGRFIAVLP